MKDMRIRDGGVFSGKLTRDEQFPWKLFTKITSDLGMTGKVDETIARSVRSRDVKSFLTSISRYEPRGMLDSGDFSTKADSFAFFQRYQLGALLKKYPFKGTDTRQPAIKKFYDSEKVCSLFNHENYRALQVLDEEHPLYFGILDEIRKDIEGVLGEFPNIDSVIGHAEHGPGVSLGNFYKDGKSTEYYKWSNLPYTVTQGTLEYARTAICSDPRWIGALDDWYRTKFHVGIGSPIVLDHFWSSVLTIVDGNIVTTVPKTALTDRTIAIEPVLNVYLQLGVDRVIRKALRQHWGYDLDSQERNQLLAHEGSVTDKLVTVDLKGASDTISLMICYLLLPPAWVSLLLDLRSPKGNLDGVEVVYEKLSSMGNGFTFVIESLVFGALVRAAIRRTRSARTSAVYGDDLIVPTTAWPFLKALLLMCGFQINEDKTFASGPFRESCGSDFFLGHAVRPVFLKRVIHEVQDYFYLHNSLLSLQAKTAWEWDLQFDSSVKYILKCLPKHIQDLFFGPPLAKAEDIAETHLYSEKRPFLDKHGNKYYWRLAKHAIVRNKHTSFFFRKLMNQLRERRAHRIWNRKDRVNTGNAFDVTRRGSVELKYERFYPVYSGTIDCYPDYCKTVAQ